MASGRKSLKRMLREHPALGGAIGFVASLALAGSASGVSMYVLRDLEAELVQVTRVEELVQVPMANREIGAGEVLTPELISPHPVRADYLPTGAALSVDELVGRTVIERLLPGEVIFPQRLTSKDTEPGLAALVAKGQRALALNLMDAGRVAGFIMPGDIVDVIVTVEDDSGLPAETSTIVEAARVLAVDEKMSELADGQVVVKPQVTLSLGALDAERVAHAARIGNVRLTLHAMADFTTVQASVQPGRRLGETSLSVVEWRETVSFEDLASMEAVLERAQRPEPVQVDPYLLRPVAQ